MGNAVENIYNSEAYRRYFDNCGPLVKPANISLTFNTDRVKRLTLETKALMENLVTSCLSLLRQGISRLDNPQSVMFSFLWVFSQKPWLCLLPAAADRCTSGQS